MDYHGLLHVVLMHAATYNQGDACTVQQKAITVHVSLQYTTLYDSVILNLVITNHCLNYEELIIYKTTFKSNNYPHFCSMKLIMRIEVNNAETQHCTEYSASHSSTYPSDCNIKSQLSPRSEPMALPKKGYIRQLLQLQQLYSDREYKVPTDF